MRKIFFYLWGQYLGCRISPPKYRPWEALFVSVIVSVKRGKRERCHGQYAALSDATESEESDRRVKAPLPCACGAGLVPARAHGRPFPSIQSRDARTRSTPHSPM